VESPKKRYSSYAKYIGIAFQMIAVLLIGALGGIKLDEYLVTSPLFTVILLCLAVVLAVYIVIKDVLKKK